jgi:hypothetical protein
MFYINNFDVETLEIVVKKLNSSSLMESKRLVNPIWDHQITSVNGILHDELMKVQ